MIFLLMFQYFEEECLFQPAFTFKFIFQIYVKSQISIIKTVETLILNLDIKSCFVLHLLNYLDAYELCYINPIPLRIIIYKGLLKCATNLAKSDTGTPYTGLMCCKLDSG